MHQLSFSYCIALSFHPNHSRKQPDPSSTQSLSLGSVGMETQATHEENWVYAILGFLANLKSLWRRNVDACSQDWFHEDCLLENVVMWTKWVNYTDIDFKVDRGKPLRQSLSFYPLPSRNSLFVFSFFKLYSVVKQRVSAGKVAITPPLKPAAHFTSGVGYVKMMTWLYWLCGP